MAAALSLDSSVTCNHQGIVSTQGSSRLTVNTKGVLLKSGIQGQSVSTACTTQTDPNTGNKQCTTVSTVTSGESSRLTVDGNGVVLDSLAGATDGVLSGKPGSLQASAVQSRLTVS
jgi:hypothetical protein